jgi:hypothetical protein
MSSTLTKQETIAKLVEKGYKDWGHHVVYDAHLLFKRLPASVTDKSGCLTNEHKLSFEVRIHDPLNIPNPDYKPHHSASLHIVGEYRDGKWCELKVYAESLDSIVKSIDQHELDLAGAWVVMRGEDERSKEYDVEESDND